MNDISKMKSLSATISRLVGENNSSLKENRINSSISKITIITIRFVKMDLDSLRSIINDVGKDIIRLKKSLN